MSVRKGPEIMRKRIISIAAALLLLLAFQLPAYADMTYSAPEDVTLGSEVDHLVATVSDGSQVSAAGETLPRGIEVGTDMAYNAAHMMNIYLRGVPQSVGTYNCVINIAGEEGTNQLICPITVIPELPAVTAGPAVNCYRNDTAQVSVSATVLTGSLSYQWYSNTVESIAGSSPIPDATGPVCQVPTNELGTMYYYCTVTNTVDGQTRSVSSAIIPVTVGEPEVASISVETLPSRTVYTAGDRLDTAGLSIRVNYSNGSSRVLSDLSGFGLYPTQLNIAGTQNVEVSYQGLTCIFQVTVDPAEEIIEGIGVLTPPRKQRYNVGDTLDPAGLSIRVYTNNGQRDVSEGFGFSPERLDQTGEQTITVTYGDKTCTFNVWVEEAEKPVSLLVNALPTKLNYTVGETLDTSGMVLRLVTNRNSSQEISSGYTCTPTVLSTAGRQQITVTYENLTCSFSVNVTAAAQTSPPVTTPPASTTQPFTPVPSVQPTATPVPTPHIIEHQSHDTGANGTLIAVIIVVALLGLLVLGSAIFIMNRGGPEAFSQEVSAWLENLIDRFRKH